MSSRKMEPPKLSLVAQFDDLCRQQNTIAASHAIHDEVAALLKSFQYCMKLSAEREKEVERLTNEVKKLTINNKTLDTKLKNVRYALHKEIEARDKIHKERDALFRKLSMVKQFLIDDTMGESHHQYGATREKVLSCLNFTHLETVNERSDTSDNSASDLEYDRTEEEFLELSKRHSQGKRKSSGAHRKSGNRTPNKSLTKRSRPASSGREEQNNNNATNELEMGVEIRDDSPPPAPKETYASRRDNSPPKAQPAPKENRSPRKGLFRLDSLYSPSRNKAKHVTASTPHLQQQLTTNRTTPQEIARTYSNQRIENRCHNFVSKKVFRPGEKCGPCGGSIGFCSTCLKCRDCRATCHSDCKDKVPIPCVPYVNRNETNKGRLTLVSDFAPSDRPKIPGLIVLCCTEIERKGLDEAGLYRIPGSDREVKDLKERILKSKNGMPSLADVDVHVLCGVVKEFLRSLDEPLVTRVLWRDFVRSSEYTDAEDKRVHIWHAVSELPTANKDTLAYMILHFQRIAQSAACKMPRNNLARVLGPTIVGHSMADPPMTELLAENKKQIVVMDALLEIASEQWENLLETQPYGGLDNGTENYDQGRRRSSIGSRPLGGTLLANGMMTPRPTRQQTMYSTTSASKPRYLKPLF